MDSRLRDLKLGLQIIQHGRHQDWRGEMTLVLEVMDRLQAILQRALQFSRTTMNRRPLEDLAVAVTIFRTNLRETLQALSPPPDVDPRHALDRCVASAALLLGRTEHELLRHPRGALS